MHKVQLFPPTAALNVTTIDRLPKEALGLFPSYEKPPTAPYVFSYIIRHTSDHKETFRFIAIESGGTAASPYAPAALPQLQRPSPETQGASSGAAPTIIPPMLSAPKESFVEQQYNYAQIAAATAAAAKKGGKVVPPPPVKLPEKTTLIRIFDGSDLKRTIDVVKIVGIYFDDSDTVTLHIAGEEDLCITFTGTVSELARKTTDEISKYLRNKVLRFVKVLVELIDPRVPAEFVPNAKHKATCLDKKKRDAGRVPEPLKPMPNAVLKQAQFQSVKKLQPRNFVAGFSGEPALSFVLLENPTPAPAQPAPAPTSSSPSNERADANDGDPSGSLAAPPPTPPNKSLSSQRRKDDDNDENNNEANNANRKVKIVVNRAKEDQDAEKEREENMRDQARLLASQLFATEDSQRNRIQNYEEKKRAELMDQNRLGLARIVASAAAAPTSKARADDSRRKKDQKEGEEKELLMKALLMRDIAHDENAKRSAIVKDEEETRRTLCDTFGRELNRLKAKEAEEEEARRRAKEKEKLSDEDLKRRERQRMLLENARKSEAALQTKIDETLDEMDRVANNDNDKDGKYDLYGSFGGGGVEGADQSQRPRRESGGEMWRVARKNDNKNAASDEEDTNSSIRRETSKSYGLSNSGILVPIADLLTQKMHCPPLYANPEAEDPYYQFVTALPLPTSEGKYKVMMDDGEQPSACESQRDSRSIYYSSEGLREEVRKGNSPPSLIPTMESSSLSPSFFKPPPPPRQQTGGGQIENGPRRLSSAAKNLPYMTRHDEPYLRPRSNGEEEDRSKHPLSYEQMQRLLKGQPLLDPQDDTKRNLYFDSLHAAGTDNNNNISNKGNYRRHSSVHDASAQLGVQTEEKRAGGGRGDKKKGNSSGKFGEGGPLRFDFPTAKERSSPMVVVPSSDEDDRRRRVSNPYQQHGINCDEEGAANLFLQRAALRSNPIGNDAASVPTQRYGGPLSSLLLEKSTVHSQQDLQQQQQQQYKDARDGGLFNPPLSSSSPSSRGAAPCCDGTGEKNIEINNSKSIPTIIIRDEKRNSSSIDLSPPLLVGEYNRGGVQKGRYRDTIPYAGASNNNNSTCNAEEEEASQNKNNKRDYCYYDSSTDAGRAFLAALRRGDNNNNNNNTCSVGSGNESLRGAKVLYRGSAAAAELEHLQQDFMNRTHQLETALGWAPQGNSSPLYSSVAESLMRISELDVVYSGDGPCNSNEDPYRHQANMSKTPSDAFRSTTLQSHSHRAPHYRGELGQRCPPATTIFDDENKYRRGSQNAGSNRSASYFVGGGGGGRHDQMHGGSGEEDGIAPGIGIARVIIAIANEQRKKPRDVSHIENEMSAPPPLYPPAPMSLL